MGSACKDFLLVSSLAAFIFLGLCLVRTHGDVIINHFIMFPSRSSAATISTITIIITITITITIIITIIITITITITIIITITITIISTITITITMALTVFATWIWKCREIDSSVPVGC
ncbi:uncharacterized protein LOC144459908 [Epinephelus lanceolatus]